MDWEREELAREVLELAGAGAPINPYRLAHRLGFSVVTTSGGCDGICLDELRLIMIDESVRGERRGFAVCHELGHYYQRRHVLKDTEWGANRIAAALLLPRVEYLRDLKRHGWDLLALKAIHPHASWEALARRIVSLRSARAFTVDKPLCGQDGDGWRSVPYGLRPCPVEREAAHVAGTTRAPCEIEAGVRSAPWTCTTAPRSCSRGSGTRWSEPSR